MRNRLIALLLLIAVGRFAQVAYQGLTYSIGDFYSTMPGAYVQTFNPTLWNSPDLIDGVGKEPSYRRGPTQMLTLLPLSFLNSWHDIALVLLVVYGLVIPASAFLMWRSFGGASRDGTLLALVMSSNLYFFPTLQAYIAREFEVVMLLGTVMLIAAARERQQWRVGAWTAYLSLFKYLPLGLLPLLVARRWWKALAGFAVTALLIIAAAHAVFGLQNFSSDGFLGNFIAHLLPGQANEFCMAYKGWVYQPQTHDAGLRFALCSMNRRVPMPIVEIYLALIAVTLAALAYGYFRNERAEPLAPEESRWRATWEFSAVLIVYTTYVYTHYYYLIFLIVPLTAVMVRAYQQRRKGLWIAWALSYVMLSAYLVPPAIGSRLLGVEFFNWYLQSYVYVPGILLLLGTILVEYARVDGRASFGSVTK